MTDGKKYQFVLNQKEVDALPRDLQFHPSPVTDPKALTREQVVAFNRSGYLKGIRVFEDREIEATRRYFDRLLERVTAEGGDSYSISTAH